MRLSRPLIFISLLTPSFWLAAVAEDTPAAGSEPVMVRGLLKPLHEATLSAEILAKIVAIPFSEGKRFKKGDVLVKFDCARYQAELAATQAELSARKKTSDNNAELATYNAAATLDVDVSAAQTEKASAQVQVAKAMLSGCTITAPWSGRVVETISHAHETVPPGKELLRILDDSTLEIDVLVPSKWLSWLKTGTKFSFKVDETGKDYPAKVTELGAQVDPVSQTIRIRAGLDKQDANLLAGMSGSAHFSTKDEVVD